MNLLLHFAEHGLVRVVQNLLERRSCDTFADQLGREPRLCVTDDSVANLKGIHVSLESNKLDNRLAFISFYR